MPIQTRMTRAACCLLCLFPLANTVAVADSISPAITGDGNTYSSEAPNSSFYGTGISGRMNEASALRFEGEQDSVSGGDLDVAVHKLAKAVQLDPSDPQGHILYARAMTAKIRSSPKDKPDRDLIYNALKEWNLIWRHDADAIEQGEAKQQARALARVAKALEKTSKEKSLVAATGKHVQQ